MVLSSLLMWVESGWSSTLKPVAESPAFAGKMDQITTKVLSNSVQKLVSSSCQESNSHWRDSKGLKVKKLVGKGRAYSLQ